MKKLITLSLLTFLCNITYAQQYSAADIDAAKHLKTADILAKGKSIAAINYPEQDCIGTINICNIIYVQDTGYLGEGLFHNEINDSTSCLGAGEMNGIWYKVHILSSGLLGFNIIPVDPSSDFDFAVFNLTNAHCFDIHNNASLMVSCNFSGSTFPTNATGPNGGPNPQEEMLIPVNAGDTYAIYVSDFSSSSSGYNLDFTIAQNVIDTSCLTGINKHNSNISAELFPNPTSQNITLKLNALKTGQDYQLQLFTATGTLVQQHNSIKTIEKTVDVSTLASGLYYYRVLTTDGKTAAGRFVKE